MTGERPTGFQAEDISEAGRRLLASGRAGDESLRLSAQVGKAIPVLHPKRQLHSWFVPLTIDDRIVAFFQMLPDGMLMRFSVFPCRAGDITTCPPAADWLDRNLIQSRGERQRRTGERASEPFLSYDRNPDRLVWAVPLSNERGEERLVYVAGESVYEPPSGDTFG